ncbi:MAG: hypothetical protein ABWK04_08410 [Hydrogenobacter sp.]|uniref:hypothetical protein n=1 Tax=Hydrogenobacter thermophilus TaxID=940 RepID=UPI0030F5FB38
MAKTTKSVRGSKNMITLQFKLDLSKEDLKTLKDLMRRQSSCPRYAYNRLLEGKERKGFQSIFGLNSRYVELAPVLGAGAMADPNTACRVLGLSEEGGIQIARHKLYGFIQLG